MGNELGRVLIIEDDPDVADVLEFALSRAGYTVFIVDDGRAGLAAARSMRPDLILCDLMLPGLDGLRLARALREGDAPVTTPLIFITAAAAYAFGSRRPTEFGACGVLEKPFDVRTIEADIRGLLALRADGG